MNYIRVFHNFLGFCPLNPCSVTCARGLFPVFWFRGGFCVTRCTSLRIPYWAAAFIVRALLSVVLLGCIFYFSALFIFSLFSDCSFSTHGGLRKGGISAAAYIILNYFLRVFFFFFTTTLHIALCYKLHAVSLEPFLWDFLGVNSIIHHSCCKSLGTNICALLCFCHFSDLLSVFIYCGLAVFSFYQGWSL